MKRSAASEAPRGFYTLKTLQQEKQGSKVRPFRPTSDRRGGASAASPRAAAVGEFLLVPQGVGYTS